MTPIGLVLPKSGVNAQGGRPVIYGLSTMTVLPSGNDGRARIMPTSVLPLEEQYRYVSLSADGNVDWTHEREWRWPCREAAAQEDPVDGPALSGFGLHMDGMGAIVKDRQQAEKVLHDLLVCADDGAPGRYDFILIGDEIASLEDLRDPDEVDTALDDAAIDLRQYRTMETKQRELLLSQFDTCVGAVDRTGIETVGREAGGCWLWLTDATHPMTRALLLSDRIEINREGRYLVNVTEFDPSLPLAEREELIERLAESLKTRHDLSATYHSVLGKTDPDGVPHYSNPPVEDRRVFNYAHDDEDF